MIRKILLSVLLFVSGSVFAQSPVAIEKNLSNAYKKIEYWAIHKQVEYSADSLEKANARLGEMLKNYAVKYPSTIGQPFKLLAKDLDISTSKDGDLRVYSWDRLDGGTMHFFTNVFQYRTVGKTYAILDEPGGDGDNKPNYNKVYSLKEGTKKYYLLIYLSIGSSKDMGQGIKIFAIENGKLNDNVKVIKTATGMHSHLDIAYDLFSIVDRKVRPSIRFDPIKKTIDLPLVGDKGQVTHKTITYKFTGKYFEKVKS